MNHGGPLPTVVILDGSVAVTGAFISAREMARALCDVANVVLVLPDASSIPSQQLEAFSAVHRLPIRPLRRSGRSIAQYLPGLARSAWKLRRLLRAHNQPTLLVNDFYLMDGTLQRLLGHKGKIFTWVRIDPNAFSVAGKVWLWLASQLSHRLIAVSRHIQTLMPRTMTSQLLYDPVSSEYLPELKRTGDSREFVFIGNYIRGKGQDVAIEALHRLLSHVPDARLRFFGGDMGLETNRRYRQELERRTADLGIQRAVIFGDFITDARPVLATALAALNLSRSESFSRTVLEACACGVPVIATDSGGPAEIVVHGKTGIIISVDDISTCASAMMALCEKPQLAHQLGTAARQRVNDVFSPTAFSELLQELLFGNKRH